MLWSTENTTANKMGEIKRQIHTSDENPSKVNYEI